MARHENSTPVQDQLKEKDDLIAALTSQLEKAVNQLDRLRRSGAERLVGMLPEGRNPVPNEIGVRLTKALDEWQDFDPAGHIARIEDDISHILDLLTHTAGKPVAEEPSSTKENDFWAQAKERILAENPPAESSEHESPAEPPAPQEQSGPAAEEAFPQIPAAPEAPVPVPLDADPAALWSAIEKRDSYLQYLTSRLRLAESQKYRPVSWDLLSQAPDNYRERLESLESLMQDHLRQAEIANSLERAVLTRERAKLAQIKNNLEVQIKRMSSNGAGPAQKAADNSENGDQDRRWKRLFSR
jgi:hypothetical protein